MYKMYIFGLCVCVRAALNCRFDGAVPRTKAIHLELVLDIWSILLQNLRRAVREARDGIIELNMTERKWEKDHRSYLCV